MKEKSTSESSREALSMSMKNKKEKKEHLWKRGERPPFYA